jgi:mono/diheme cytochrome c family protein
MERTMHRSPRRARTAGDRPTAAALLLALLCVASAACSESDTLGGERPPEVLLPAAPTYEDGVKALLDLKCAYCHVAGSGRLEPDDAPDDLDLETYETTLLADGTVMRGADSIGRWIFDGMLRHDIDDYEGGTIRQMPLDYGTQLTDDEIAGLARWSARGAPRDGSPPPVGGDPVRGEALYQDPGPAPAFESCVGCHALGGGVTGRGPDVRRAAVTVPKLREMWLTKLGFTTALGTADALDLRAYMLDLPDLVVPVDTLAISIEPAGTPLVAGGPAVTLVARALDPSGALIPAFMGSIRFGVGAGSTGAVRFDPANGEAQAHGGEASVELLPDANGAMELRAEVVQSGLFSAPLAVAVVPPVAGVALETVPAGLTTVDLSLGSLPLRARAVDGGGATVTGFDEAVRFSVISGPGTVSPQDAPATGGAADTTLQLTGTGQLRLQAELPTRSLSSAELVLDVVQGPARTPTMVLLSTVPPGLTATEVGVGFRLRAEVRDAAGLIPSYAGDVSFAQQAGGGAASLGAAFVTAVGGVAEVDVTPTAAGDYDATASISAPVALTSASLRVRFDAPTPDRLALFTEPAGRTSLSTAAPLTLRCEALDATGAVKQNFTGEVIFEVTGGTASAAFTPQRTNAAGGIARSTLSATANGSLEVRARIAAPVALSSPSLQLTVTDPLLASGIRLEVLGSATVGAGTQRTLRATVEDQFGQALVGFADPVRFDVSGDGGGRLLSGGAGVGQVSATDGVAEVDFQANDPGLAMVTASITSPALTSAAVSLTVPVPDFVAEVYPVLQARCANCHTTRNSGGLRFTATAPYDMVNVASVRSNLDRVEPFDPAASFLFLRIDEQNPPVGPMPPGAAQQVPLAERDLIRAWILGGAP